MGLIRRQSNNGNPCKFTGELMTTNGSNENSTAETSYVNSSAIVPADLGHTSQMTSVKRNFPSSEASSSIREEKPLSTKFIIPDEALNPEHVSLGSVSENVDLNQWCTFWQQVPFTYHIVSKAKEGNLDNNLFSLVLARSRDNKKEWRLYKRIDFELLGKYTYQSGNPGEFFDSDFSTSSGDKPNLDTEAAFCYMGNGKIKLFAQWSPLTTVDGEIVLTLSVPHDPEKRKVMLARELFQENISRPNSSLSSVFVENDQKKNEETLMKFILIGYRKVVGKTSEEVMKITKITDEERYQGNNRQKPDNVIFRSYDPYIVAAPVASSQWYFDRIEKLSSTRHQRTTSVKSENPESDAIQFNSANCVLPKSLHTHSSPCNTEFIATTIETPTNSNISSANTKSISTSFMKKKTTLKNYLSSQTPIKRNKTENSYDGLTPSTKKRNCQSQSQNIYPQLKFRSPKKVDGSQASSIKTIVQSNPVMFNQQKWLQSLRTVNGQMATATYATPVSFSTVDICGSIQHGSNGAITKVEGHKHKDDEISSTLALKMTNQREGRGNSRPVIVPEIPSATSDPHTNALLSLIRTEWHKARVNEGNLYAKTMGEKGQSKYYMHLHQEHVNVFKNVLLEWDNFEINFPEMGRITFVHLLGVSANHSVYKIFTKTNTAKNWIPFDHPFLKLFILPEAMPNKYHSILKDSLIAQLEEELKKSECQQISD